MSLQKDDENLFKWDSNWSQEVPNLLVGHTGLEVTQATYMSPIRADTGYTTGKHVWRMVYTRGEHVKIGICTDQANKNKQLGSDSNGWCLYLYNGQLRAGSSSGGNEFSSKYSPGTIIRVELDLDSTPRTLSFTLADDKGGTGEVKKAFDLPAAEGTKYYPAMALQHTVYIPLSLSLSFCLPVSLSLYKYMS